LPEGSSFCPECEEKVSDASSSTSVENKKIITGILAIVLGGLGIHYFYLGKTTAGILSIVLSLCSCGIWTIIMFIQGILMLLMSDDDFVSKYVNTDRTLPLF